MDELLRYSLVSQRWPAWLKYTITFLLISVGLLLHAVIFGNNGTIYPFILFYPSIILVSLFLDQGNGIFAAILSSILTAFYILPTETAAASASTVEVVAVVLFLITGLAMAALLESLHGLFVTLTDANAEIAVLAQARGVLLRELAHRMRNDMAALNSLFLLQAHTLEDPAARHAFQNAAKRMQTIARVHERLTVDTGQIVIDSKRFVTDLCDDLRLSGLSGRPVALELSAESCPISHQKAVAVGLIINELVTNALKYAFPNDAQGKIRVSFHKKGESFHLRVSDNGIGMGDEGGVQGTGLGLELVRTLAAQLGGMLNEHHPATGADFEVVFPAV